MYYDSYIIYYCKSNMYRKIHVAIRPLQSPLATDQECLRQACIMDILLQKSQMKIKALKHKRSDWLLQPRALATDIIATHIFQGRRELFSMGALYTLSRHMQFLGRKVYPYGLTPKTWEGTSPSGSYTYVYLVKTAMLGVQ